MSNICKESAYQYECYETPILPLVQCCAFFTLRTGSIHIALLNIAAAFGYIYWTPKESCKVNTKEILYGLYGWTALIVVTCVFFLWCGVYKKIRCWRLAFATLLLMKMLVDVAYGTYYFLTTKDLRTEAIAVFVVIMVVEIYFFLVVLSYFIIDDVRI